MSNNADLFVKRIGFGNNSYMITKKYIMNLNKGYYTLSDGYLFCQNNLLLNKSNGNGNKLIDEHMCIDIQCYWEHAINKYEKHEGNILGSFGTLYVNDDFNIPICDTKYLNYYNCKLINNNDTFYFETFNDKSVELFEMSIGVNYVNNYLYIDGLGNGFYLEYHNTPHYHQPLNIKSSGYLIIGKQINEDQIRLSAFQIPYNKAIYMSPYVIHSDAFLVGDYNVAYTITDDFSTVILKNKCNKKVYPKIINF
jgi:hypothetical protein